MNPPLALYVHIPWCERKCPYCDFNSHVSDSIDEALYTQHLINEMEHFAANHPTKPLVSMFFGGGTPSLFSAKSIGLIIAGAERIFGFESSCEITLEANPGSSEQQRFKDYQLAGVNRISIGIQSFNDQHLKRLGRIHSSDEARSAIEAAQNAGLNHLNIDLMYALGEQSYQQAEEDINTALSYGTEHLSWYQLTIEQNTEYFKRPPQQPNDIVIETMETSLRALLSSRGFDQYEVSAYCRNDKSSTHNRNYWEFGDYLGIGAGAHSKITHQTNITRVANTRLPKDYLSRDEQKAAKIDVISDEDIAAEFMMNALRLRQGVPTPLFIERTGLQLNQIQTKADQLAKQDLMQPLESGRIMCTPKGYQLLNGVVEYFLT